MSNKLEDLGKSYELAYQIEMIKSFLITMDLEHAKKAAESFIDQGNWQDSAAVLNPSYNPEKSDLLRLSGKALMKLVEYVELSKEIDEMKQKIAANGAVRESINKMFM